LGEGAELARRMRGKRKQKTPHQSACGCQLPLKGKPLKAALPTLLARLMPEFGFHWGESKEGSQPLFCRTRGGPWEGTRRKGPLPSTFFAHFLCAKKV